MQDIKDYFCPNPDCKYCGLRGTGNIIKAGRYALKGSAEKKQLLKCSVCGMRFSETQNDLFSGCHYGEQTIRGIIVSIAEGNGIRETARKLGLSKDRVNIIVLRAWEYADTTLSSLLCSLHLNDDQLNELWLFFHKGALRRRRKPNIT